MGDVFYPWELCIRRDEGWTRVFQRRYALDDTFTITCEVSNADEPFKCDYDLKS
jgi:hypothetical protein